MLPNPLSANCPYLTVQFTPPASTGGTLYFHSLMMTKCSQKSPVVPQVPCKG